MQGSKSAGYHSATVAACCQDCLSNTKCDSYVWQPTTGTCWLLSSGDGGKTATDRMFGVVGAHSPSRPSGPQFSNVEADLYVAFWVDFRQFCTCLDALNASR